MFPFVRGSESTPCVLSQKSPATAGEDAIMAFLENIPLMSPSLSALVGQSIAVKTDVFFSPFLS